MRRSRIYLASTKPPEMIGKGDAGDLPCRGARGVPLFFPLSQRVGWLGTRYVDLIDASHHIEQKRVYS